MRTNDVLVEAIEKLGATLGAKIEELPEKIAESRPIAARQAIAARRANPTAAIQRRVDRLKSLRDERDEVLDAVGDAIDALDEGDTDEAEEILDGVLDLYEADEDENVDAGQNGD